MPSAGSGTSGQPSGPSAAASSGAGAAARARSAGVWKPPVTTTTGRSRRRLGGADPPRHVRLAGGVVLPGFGLAADQVEVGVEPFGEPVRVADLEQVVPQDVGVVDGELAEQPPGRLGVALLGVGVAVVAVGERGMPGGQVDEPDVGARGAARVQRDPFRRVAAERRPAPADAVAVPVVAEDRDGRFVAEQQLVQPSGEVGGPLDQDVRGPQPLDRLADQPGAGGAVVPDPDERDRHQPGSRCRAACSAFHCSPLRRDACCSR
ncbi:hypothetical protein BJF79_46595 [Actinomadura sp. CNU-125]|nr:hypothetical protein BJF79_46595 [Actinomadura sp. CNU-125]